MKCLEMNCAIGKGPITVPGGSITILFTLTDLKTEQSTVVLVADDNESPVVYFP